MVPRVQDFYWWSIKKVHIGFLGGSDGSKRHSGGFLGNFGRKFDLVQKNFAVPAVSDFSYYSKTQKS